MATSPSPHGNLLISRETVLCKSVSIAAQPQRMEDTQGSREIDVLELDGKQVKSKVKSVPVAIQLSYILLLHVSIFSLYSCVPMFLYSVHYVLSQHHNLLAFSPVGHAGHLSLHIEVNLASSQSSDSKEEQVRHLLYHEICKAVPRHASNYIIFLSAMLHSSLCNLSRRKLTKWHGILRIAPSSSDDQVSLCSRHEWDFVYSLVGQVVGINADLGAARIRTPV